MSIPTVTLPSTPASISSVIRSPNQNDASACCQHSDRQDQPHACSNQSETASAHPLGNPFLQNGEEDRTARAEQQADHCTCGITSDLCTEADKPRLLGHDLGRIRCGWAPGRHDRSSCRNGRFLGCRTARETYRANSTRHSNMSTRLYAMVRAASAYILAQ